MPASPKSLNKPRSGKTYQTSEKSGSCLDRILRRRNVNRPNNISVCAPAGVFDPNVMAHFF